MNIYSVIKKPHVTEKTSLGSDVNNTVVIVVDKDANKIEIGRAIEKIFKVKVLDVRVMNVPGKKKRTGRVLGQRRSWKKAIVTLAQGNRIETMEGV